MATYLLLHGAGSDPWYWHLAEPRLADLGHRVVAPDLGVDDDARGFEEYADAAVAALGAEPDGDHLVVVAQSLAGFTAPLVCVRVPVALVVLVAAMVPTPGERAGEWWSNTGHTFPEPFDPAETFLHDVPPDVAAESAAHVRAQSETPFLRPWTPVAWPDVPTRFLLCRHDRFFPPSFLRPLVQARLGLAPDELDGGHLPALHSPDALVAYLDGCRAAAGV